MATKPRELSRKAKTLAEIDIRCHDLMLKFLEEGIDTTTSEMMGYIRAAYAQGYTDCLKEPEGHRGKWIKDLGYGVKGVNL